MKLAFLFPGQGSDIAFVGRDLADAAPLVRDLMEQALEGLELGWGSLWAKSGRALESTAVLQPVLTALTLGVHLTLEEGGCVPTYVAGHSLGEISAWSAAGGISSSEAIRLAGARGRLMRDAASSRKGGMLAVRVGSFEALGEALDLGNRFGRAELAAMNTPGEWVVSGDYEALRAIAATYPSTPLPVSGAWHGSGMAESAQEWSKILDSISPSSLGAAFLSNRTGEVVRDFRDIPRLLVEAFTHPVRWTDTMEALDRGETTDLITVGPGKVLRSLARGNGLGDRRFHRTDRPADLLRTLELLGS